MNLINIMLHEKKPVTKEHILYDSICKKFQNRQSKEAEHRLVVAQGLQGVGGDGIE